MAVSGIMSGLVTIMADDIIHVLARWSIRVSSLFTIVPGFVTVGISNFVRAWVYVEVEGIYLIF